MKKKKVFVLMVSKYFPATHPRAGNNTDFIHKILASFGKAVVDYSMEGSPIIQKRENTERLIGFEFNSKGEVYNKQTLPWWEPKLHTIRGNYALWAKRAEKINRGEAVLSLRQWTGSPYNFKRDGSKQEEFLVLDKISVQKVSAGPMPVLRGGKTVDQVVFEVDGKLRPIDILAKNDGLSEKDLMDWFDIPFSDAALIHFTENFKY